LQLEKSKAAFSANCNYQKSFACAARVRILSQAAAFGGAAFIQRVRFSTHEIYYYFLYGKSLFARRQWWFFVRNMKNIPFAAAPLPGNMRAMNAAYYFLPHPLIKPLVIYKQAPDMVQGRSDLSAVIKAFWH
jgi:hypothetical protein